MSETPKAEHAGGCNQGCHGGVHLLLAPHATRAREGDLTEHAGDCLGTLCLECGCCAHCVTSPDDEYLCVSCQGCSDRRCACSEAIR